MLEVIDELVDVSVLTDGGLSGKSPANKYLISVFRILFHCTVFVVAINNWIASDLKK